MKALAASPKLTPEDRRFANCVGVSLACHLLFFIAASRGPGWFSGPADNSPVEIDLTRPPGPPGPPKLGAPKPLVKNAPVGPNVPVENPPPKMPEKAAEPPKDWTLPGPETKKVEEQAQPAPTAGGEEGGKGTAVQPGGSGDGVDYGDPNGKGFGGGGGRVDQFPRLLNRDEVLRNLRKYYPESERRAGREGEVLVYVHISAEGKVTGVEVAQTAGAAFDLSAQQVARLMKFAPALVGTTPVGVKMPQRLKFRLED